MDSDERLAALAARNSGGRFRREAYRWAAPAFFRDRLCLDSERRAPRVAARLNFDEAGSQAGLT